VIALFREALHVQDFFRDRGWRACFIGGIALQHWGEPRVTRDLDLALFTGFGGEAAFIDALLGAFSARVEDARRFALEHRVLLLRTPPPANVDVDIALSALPFEEDMVNRATAVEFEPGVRLIIYSAEDLFVMKTFANRLRDRADLEGIARRRGRDLDWDAILERLAPLAAVKDDSAMMRGVERLREQFGSGAS
jgi:Nucleotidyl transferase AbiEii toxin, Type IV TA system